MSVNVLVTGGAGYIGSHACKALYKNGFNPIVVDNLSTGFSRNVKWGPLEVGSISDKNFMRSIFRKYMPSGVLHFAGSAYVAESVVKPAEYYANNFVATLGLLDVMLEYKINVLVFSSSCATYGIPKYLPLDLDHPQNPISPYGFTKYFSEEAIKSYGEAYGLRYSILRYFNAAGADWDGELREEHEPETHLIPLAIQSALFGTPFKVFGDDYPTKDGTCIRDYVHVSNLAEAHVCSLNKLLWRDVSSETLNLGAGKGYSVLEILKLVELATNKKISIEICDMRKGDPPELWAEPDLEFSDHILKADIHDIIQSSLKAMK
jgi:UDP-arabinose 4-epimerase